jgi:hypothetical protein
MELHAGQRAALMALLNSLTILPDGSLGYSKTGPNREINGFADQILKAPPWKSLINNSDLWSLVWGVVYRGIRDVSGKHHGALSALENGTLATKIANDIAKSLSALPAKYDVYIPMPGICDLKQSEVQLTPTVGFVNSAAGINRDMVAPIPLNGLLRLLDVTQQGAETSTRYLRVYATGYGDSSPNSPAIREALAVAKRFVFLGIASGAYVLDPDFQFWRDSDANTRNPVLLKQQGEDDIFRVDPGFEVSKLFSRIRFATPLTVPDPTSTVTLLTAPERPAATDSEMRSAIQIILRTAIDFMSAQMTDAEPVHAAMEWYMDAEATRNESIAFLQRCIGLEALLGGGESRRDVTERLGDRYAYLLGKTETQRSALRKTFKNMYGHRSAVVHGRATRLSDEHRHASYIASDMLLHATLAEIRNLTAARKKT